MGLHREEPVKWSHVSAVFVFSLEAGFLEAEKIITALILSSVQILSKFFFVFFLLPGYFAMKTGSSSL